MRRCVSSRERRMRLPPSIPLSEFTFRSDRRLINFGIETERTVFEKLTFKSVEVRAVCVPLRRPVVSKVGLFKDWPLILIDLQTEEGVVGRSYLEPYLKNAARSIVPMILDLAAMQAGKPLAPLADFQ